MKTVLVVDDEREIRHMLRMMLEISSFEVLEAEDGEAAFKTAVHELPDLILMDVMMPNLDGLSVCQKLRANEATAYIPILMMSGDATSTNQKMQIEQCADKFIRKPFQFGQLLAHIELAMNNVIKVPA